ncbi:MAG TPA: pectinesterase family protein [Bacteroidota bacterium]|nr:pectinesterase family protein [Bacteroidota bacterium]
MNKKNCSLAVLLYILAFPFCTFAKETANIIVAQDGSGQYTSIQAAINSVPLDNNKNIIILIRHGVYHEKIYITRSFITLVGENRDSTQIVFAELRKNWVKDHNGSDYGSATINIDSLVSDITLANLTVHNNYGSLYGDHDHQFAIRGGGTRIIILDCNIIADGGDTISLWNRVNGMYYHSNCYFEGWVDFVCPRGWCYITDSKFYGHNLSASLWHDGSADKDQKFVIRYSEFDGVQDFSLGRHHRDAQIYLLDCIFSRVMADRPIYHPVSPSSLPWQWGSRHYYYNCHRVGGDYDWFRNNLETAEGHPNANDVTAAWTFAGKWNPEETMPPVLSTVSQPMPRDGAYDLTTDGIQLKWLPSRNATSHNIYFGKSENPDYKSNQTNNKFDTGKLEVNTRYYWRVDEVTETDTIKGALWHFTTKKY